MTGSLAARVALAVAALTILAIALTTAVAIVSTDGQVRGDVDSFLEQRTEEILDGSRRGPDGKRDDRDQDETVDLPRASETDAEVQQLDESGEIVANSAIVLPVSSADVALADRDGNPVFRTVDIDGAQYRILTTHINGGGALQVARSIDATTSLRGLIREQLLYAGLALAVIVAGLAWWTTRRTLRPLGELTAAAERVAATTDLDTPIDTHDRNDEIGRLATSFNGMLDALASSRAQQHRLVQDAAHELRTPLTSVNANIDLLVRAPDLPADERSEILTGVRAELRQLGTLFTEIIELATDDREAVEHVPVDLVDVVERAVADVRRRANNPVHVDAERTIVLGDPDALERAITNLLGNAVKYSPTDSAIDVRVSGGTVAVRDRGPGIPEDQRRMIWDRFHRSEEARALPGSGLGLAIVHKIVADHSGRVFVEDADPGPGAVVGFVLPT